MELEKQLLLKLKTILQSKWFYILLLAFIMFYIIIFTKIVHYQSKFLIDTTSIKGMVVNYKYDKDNNKITLTIKGREKVIGYYYLNDDEEVINLLGKTVLVKGMINEPFTSTIPNSFDYQNYLYQNHIYKTFKIDKWEIIKNENIFYKIKNYIIKRIDNFDNKVQEYLKLFILGDSTLLDSNTYNLYRSNGIWHLFAISGMHINLLLVILNNLLIKYKHKDIVICLILGYFMFLTSFSPSVMRVTYYFYFSLLFKKLKLNLNPKQVLIIVFSLLILFNPFIIYNTGFQYSFLISYSLMNFSKLITGSYLMKILKISSISFLVSLPITVNLNYEINPSSILLNIIYVPLISLFIFPFTIISFLVFPLSFILRYILIFLEVSNKFLNLFSLNIIMPKMSWVVILVYYIFIYFSYYNKKYLILLFLLILFNISIPKWNNNYEIYYFDVGQGDASAIISPKQKDVVMIDTGDVINEGNAENILHFYKSRGISKINYLILSHGDSDHMGNASYIINNFKVENVIFNCGAYNDLETSLMKDLKDKKINYLSCIKEINLKYNKLLFLNSLEYDNENDNSSVIYTKIDNYTFLFMGDASSKREEDIEKSYFLPKIDILKVGHHGSKTSSSKEFLEVIEPKYAIISVGRKNRYGHPNKEVLDNLSNTKIYRTDLNGSILFKIKNHNIDVKEYN